MNTHLSSLAYVGFHVAILSSLLLGKLLYKQMLLPTRKEILSYIPVSIIFIIWDYLVTDLWWHFNPNYVLSALQISFLKLPFEEIAFFFTVPYALLVFLKNVASVYSVQNWDFSSQKVRWVLGAYRLMCIAGMYHFFIQEEWYSFIIVFGLLISDIEVLQHKVIFVGLFFTLCTTLLFNYYLTSLPIVLYTDSYKTGILVGTIPIEDFGYATLLYLWIVKGLYAAKDTFLSASQEKT